MLLPYSEHVPGKQAITSVSFVPLLLFQPLASDLGIVAFTKHDPQHLSGLVRRILYQFIGPN